MLEFLKDNPDINLANLGYMTTARRVHHKLRAAYCGRGVGDIIAALTRDIDAPGKKISDNKRQHRTTVVFVFSGQGGHYAGMAKELFRTCHQFRGIIAELQGICDSLGFPSIASLIANSDAKMESVSIVQLRLSLFALEIALAELWKSWGVEPDVVIGHSIGEYAALCAAGVLSWFDAMLLVGKRAQIIQSKLTVGTRAMLSISGTAGEVSTLISESDLMGCEVSCFNGPGMVVLSGERQKISTLQSLLKKQGLKCQLLDIPYAMHSSQMDTLTSDFGDVAHTVLFNQPTTKFISTYLGKQVTDASSFGVDYLIKHAREPVQLQQAVASCVSQGIVDAKSLWLEIGPSTACLGLIRGNIDISPSNALTSLEKGENDWKSVSTSLAALYNAGLPICWREYHKDFVDSLSLINLPPYAFDARNFWLTYKSNDQHLQRESNGILKGEESRQQLISTCLHHCLKRVDDKDKQHASFTTVISHPSLMQAIEGHKVSNVTVLPGGVLIDMALTAAQHLLSETDSSTATSLSVGTFEIYRPVVPNPRSRKLVQIDITRFKQSSNEMAVSFKETSGSESYAITDCIIRLQAPSMSRAGIHELSSSMQTKSSKLNAAAETGCADRVRRKLFYRLFSHLMNYSDMYKGIEEAIVSEDFREMIAQVRFPPHNKGYSNSVLSPC